MSTPDLITELAAARPLAPSDLRAHVREIASREQPRAVWPRLRFPRRLAVVAIPAAAALAVASSAIVGFSRSEARVAGANAPTPEAAPSTELGATTQDSTVGPTPGRAQRVSATLVVEVADPDAVSESAQKALELTRSLGGHVVSASVATGERGSAALTVRVPVARVEDAIVGLSALGRIVNQQVTIDDLQEQLDALTKRQASLQAQIARISARLETGSDDAETRAALEARLKTLRQELRKVKAGITSTSAEAQMATIQLTIVTPGASGAIPPPPSRIDRTIDEALNVLAWEGVIALGVVIVLAPFALVVIAAWLGRRLHRRREEERLLAV